MHLNIEMRANVRQKCTPLSGTFPTPLNTTVFLICVRIGTYLHFTCNCLSVFRRISGDRIDVNTVDGYQGSERDVIIISCVRSGY